ncbi:MAG: hemolysin family protein [Burkholderiaceae bacterium]
MSLSTQLLLILVLICASAFFSLSEISLAAARKLRLRQLVDEGSEKAQQVLDLQEHPGHFFTVVQIGVNAVAILGGIIGEAAFTPYFAAAFGWFLSPEMAETLGFAFSFLLVTMLFVLFADLIPKRIGLAAPEPIAMGIVRPMQFLVKAFMPFVWIFTSISTVLLRAVGLPTSNDDRITSADIMASVDAGAAAGLLARPEQAVIENVFELESRTVPSSMTARESIVYFTLDESETSIKKKIVEQPHSKYMVCDEDVDHVIGYVDSKDLLRRALDGKLISFKEQGMLKTAQFVPDSLTLSEILEVFKRSREDFAVIINEYALVVGLITLNDVMSTVMGDLVGQPEEAQIVQRDADSWLIDGTTPITDVERALDLDGMPDDTNYETVGGFMMFMLRKIPKRTDRVDYGGYRFEVIDVDNHKIDQVLVTRHTEISGEGAAT